MMVVMERRTWPEIHRAAPRKLYGAAEAEIGSRVFPLPAPPVPSMPSVGTRRSTRVFVPKISSGGADANASGRRGSRVLRSGKRLAVNKSTDGWQEDFGSGGAPLLLWGKVEEGDRNRLGFSAECEEQEAQMTNGVVVESVSQKLDDPEENLESLQAKKYAIVYERKRQRQLSDSAASSSSSVADATSYMNRRFGIVYVPKRHRKKSKVTPLPQTIEQTAAIFGVDFGLASRKPVVLRRGLRISTLAENFAKKVGIRENSLHTGVTDPVVLLLIAESSHANYSHLISRLIICMLKWMRGTTAPLVELVAFIFSGSFASIFSEQGVHILPLRGRCDNVVFTTPRFFGGLCRIYDIKQSIPIIWLDYLALASFFRSLHVSMLLRSLYLPHFILRYLKCSHLIPSAAAICQGNDSIARAKEDSLGIVFSGTSVMQSPEKNVNHDAYTSGSQNAITLSGFSKHSKKRSFSRYLRSRNLALMRMQAGPQFSRQSKLNDSGATFEGKQEGLQAVMKPVSIEIPDHGVEDLLSFIDESDASTPLSVPRHRKSVKKSPMEQNKELKYALAEVKQNIDSVHCRANVLVTDVDRCWREEGFEVMLELLGSQEWAIAVKFQGEAMYLHKSLDIRPCVVNRFTHAYMWAGDYRWKLEFLDRWDWLVFKELQMECCERNLQESSSRMIPVPVFEEVSGYEEGSDANFSRPDVYIKIEDDEVQRAISSKVARYDMDSGDEQWLTKHNSSIQHANVGPDNDISVDEFEKIIYAMEKDSYRNVDDVFDKEKALNHYQHFGKRERLLSIYDYWTRKRSKNHSALVREFQGQPLRPAQFIHKPVLRKKRSLKRKRSQTIKTKSEVLEQVHDGALRRVHEAENAAKRASEFALQLRSRAQILMSNAELAMYKSVMVLRIADFIEATSESKDPASVILD
ncbi:uncharacterized protein LOC121967150 [Zingiber officinale]|uniref:uncharacterized protein LOC121967150 n=1 Tax=Zingiber officinale TaxID=94328 RepID=UPI001C4A98F7|nr:uncharacterized protein LOC121967150 [Zingiber officinale]